ncbi:MAG: thiamine phosphate synthase [Myxococcota bacterium]
MRDAAAFAGLHVLADDDARWPLDPVAQARAACAGGARVVQLRAKRATDATALAWAREIRALARARGVAFVVNDRVDLALLADADGVHLGQDDVPPGALPGDVRARLAIGRSTHSPAQARAARAEGVDYVAFGPLFDTSTKDTGYAARGLDALREIARLAAPLPVVAIGGIGAGNAASSRAAGAAGIAVLSAVAAARDAEAGARAAGALVRAFESDATAGASPDARSAPARGRETP